MTATHLLKKNIYHFHFTFEKIHNFSEKKTSDRLEPVILLCNGHGVKLEYTEKATKFEKNLALKICCYSVTSNFTWKIFSNFVSFSKRPNFTKSGVHCT